MSTGALALRSPAPPGRRRALERAERRRDRMGQTLADRRRGREHHRRDARQHEPVPEDRPFKGAGRDADPDGAVDPSSGRDRHGHRHEPAGRPGWVDVSSDESRHGAADLRSCGERPARCRPGVEYRAAPAVEDHHACIGLPRVAAHRAPQRGPVGVPPR